jgi:hypothetical protein
MKSQLFDLPFNITADLLSAWLPLKCLSELDSALCNRSSRDVYMEILQCDGFALNASSYLAKEADFMQWIVDRRVKVIRASVNCYGMQPAPSDRVKEFFASVGATLQDLS